MSDQLGYTADFFGNQEQARKRTGLLVILFIVAVVLIILCVYLAVSATTFFLMGYGKGSGTGATQTTWNPFDPQLFLGVAVATIVVILLGSLFKILALGGGGAAVAKMLGGRLITPHTEDPDERKVLNVVEEMAIASGVPVPDVYMLGHEMGINAFAAGYTTANAVIGVTRGAVTQLSRDELQGVIAHEFSHILNGDMRLNIRLIGILNGILLIGITGRIMFELVARGSFYSSGSRRSSSRSSSNKDGRVTIVLLALGAALFIIGYIGVFFGALIKAAVSRQREFLADASAVQFTRNPAGIGGALKKIGGLDQHARIRSARAEEASHMFFGNAVRSSFSGGFLSTHPPLPVRIKQIEPNWDGSFPTIEQETPEVQKRYDDFKQQRAKDKAQTPPPLPLPIPIPGMPGSSGMPGVSGLDAGAGVLSAEMLAADSVKRAAAETRLNIRPEEIMYKVGKLTPDGVAHAMKMLSEIPEVIRMTARHPVGSRLVIGAVLLNEEPDVRAEQMNTIREMAGDTAAEDIERIVGVVDSLGPAARLPLLDLTLPALRGLDAPECERFLDSVDKLVKADMEVSLFEFALIVILRKHIQPIIDGRVDRSRPRFYSINAVAGDVACVLSAMARMGADGAEEVQRAFAAGKTRLGDMSKSVELLAPELCTFDRIDESLENLAASIPGIKRRVMEALSWCTAADEAVTVEEGELLRAIGEAIDCPIPPLVAPKT